MRQFIHIQRTNMPDVSLLNTIETSSVIPDVSLLDTIETSSVIPDVSLLNKIEISSVDISRNIKRPDVMDISLLLLSLLALFLWSISLQIVPLNDINDLGLISALSPRIIAALGILVVSFTLTLQRREVRASLLSFQLICIILILYGTQVFIEETHLGAGGGVLFKHSAYTDYILRTGTVNPWLDFYFNWPGFFVLSAFFTKVFGYSTILGYAAWARVFFNLIYLGPMYMIFTSITVNKRLVWLSLLLFQLTNWVAADYFSPQGLNFFLYLVVIAILLKWFKMPPKHPVQPEKDALLVQLKKDASLVQLKKDTSWVQKYFVRLKAPDPQSPSIKPWQRHALLCSLILVYGLEVSSHPLTAFVTLFCVFVLVIFRRCYPFWLPMLMAAMALAWVFFMARPYLSEHARAIFATFLDPTANVPSNLTSGKFVGEPLYQVIGRMRLSMTALVWLLAFLGSIKRLKQGNRGSTYILLALAAFPSLAAPQYGREMLLRIYLFTEPFMVFFAASLFLDKTKLLVSKTARIRATFSWRTAAIITTNLILLSMYFFARYGDERVSYITSDEWNAAQYLQQIAPAKSFILTPWGDAPMDFEYYEADDFDSLSVLWPSAVINTNPNKVIQIIEAKHNSHTYIFFSQEEQLQASVWQGLPSDRLQQLETALLQTGKFKLIYHNADAQILQFIE